LQKPTAAASSATTPPSEEGSSGGSGVDVEALTAEKESLKEIMREQYVYLLEMDTLVREKLFILQARIL
jgi:hypothetical protein